MPEIDAPEMQVNPASVQPILGVPLDELYHSILGIQCRHKP